MDELQMHHKFKLHSSYINSITLYPMFHTSNFLKTASYTRKKNKQGVKEKKYYRIACTLNCPKTKWLKK